MDFTTLQNRVNFILDNNDSQADNTFAAARVKQALNWAYRDEVRQMHLEGNRRWFLSTYEMSWAASTVTMPLPVALQQKHIISVFDITNNDPGDALAFGSTGHTGKLHFKDRLTLQWGTNGPNSAKTLRFAFYAAPTELVENGDEPVLIPEMFHEVLVWSAVVFLLEVADRQAPGMFYRRLDDLRIDLWKYTSQARPASEALQPQNTYPDRDEEIHVG